MSPISSIQKYIPLLEQSPDNGYTSAILQKALSDSNLHTGFAQLRSLPSVQLLGVGSPQNHQNEHDHPLLRTLDLFSYGCYNDYVSASDGTYVTLTDAQVFKLKALTVVSVVHSNCQQQPNNPTADGTELNHNLSINNPRVLRRNRRRAQNVEEEKLADVPRASATTTPLPSTCNIVPYDALRSATGLQTSQHNPNSQAHSVEIRQLEDLLIHCIYSNLLPRGSKLDQKNMCLVLHLHHSSNPEGPGDDQNDPDASSSKEVLCRDIKLETDLPEMMEALETLYRHGQDVQQKLMTNLNKLRTDAGHDLQEWNRIDVQMQLAKSEVGGQGSKKSSGGGGGTASAGVSSGTSGSAGIAAALVPETMAMSGSMMEWAPSASAGARQVKRSRGGSTSGGSNLSKGFFGFGGGGSNSKA